MAEFRANFHLVKRLPGRLIEIQFRNNMALSLPQSTIIVDAGSFSARFGFSGDDAPAANFRSMCGHFKGDRNSDSSSASFKSKNYNAPAG